MPTLMEQVMALTGGREIELAAARTDAARVEVIHCHTCEADRAFFRRFQERYGWTDTCLTCGETWTDGEMHPRPFAPRWRKESVEGAVRTLARLLARVVPDKPPIPETISQGGASAGDAGAP